jgi:hypothetical protein
MKIGARIPGVLHLQAARPRSLVHGIEQVYEITAGADVIAATMGPSHLANSDPTANFGDRASG